MRTSTKLTITYILFIIGYLIFMGCLISCSTSKKLKNSTKTTVAKNETAKIDSVSVKKDNTVTTVEKSDDYEKETVIEFDTMPNGGGFIYPNPVEDYFQPVKRITIKEKGTKKENIVIATNKQDSTVLIKRTDTQVITTTTIKNKDKKTTSYWGWLWISLIAAAVWFAGWYFGIWKILFAFIKRNKDEYPIKYKFKNPKL